MSASVMPSSARPCSSRKWSTTPASAAIVLPFRSATEVIDASQMTASLPVELSLTTTIFCSAAGGDAEDRVVQRLGVDVELPATSASSDAV